MIYMTEREIKFTLGMNINRRRNDMGLSKEKLAEKLDVSKNTISDLENGEKFIRAKNLSRLAMALEIDVYELFKPDTVLPDKPVDIIAKFSGEVQEIIEKMGDTYIEEMKRINSAN